MEIGSSQMLLLELNKASFRKFRRCNAFESAALKRAWRRYRLVLTGFFRPKSYLVLVACPPM